MAGLLCGVILCLQVHGRQHLLEFNLVLKGEIFRAKLTLVSNGLLVVGFLVILYVVGLIFEVILCIQLLGLRLELFALVIIRVQLELGVCQRLGGWRCVYH